MKGAIFNPYIRIGEQSPRKALSLQPIRRPPIYRVMDGPLGWYASISGMIAAFMIAWNHSTRVTGWGFILFTTCSIAWVISGLFSGESALAVQNVILTGINVLGIYRYLIRRKPPEEPEAKSG